MAMVLVYLSLNCLEAIEGTCNQWRLWSDCAMCRLIWVFAGCTSLIVGFVVHNSFILFLYETLHCGYTLKRLYQGSSSNLGPVVQSVVSLTSSLRVISLTVLADSIYNILIFFAEKMWVAFALQKLLTFFQQKISAYLRITRCKF